MADNSNLIRSLVVRAEDARLIDDMLVMVNKNVGFNRFFCFELKNGNNSNVLK